MSIIQIPQILLPAEDIDMSKWAVNACDQYTSDVGYWQDVERIARGCPSAYNLIFPEVYLKDRPEERIARINSTMREYLSGGIFTMTEGIILVERTTLSGTRRGIVLAVDLEQYSYIPQDKSLIRSTEATILQRIPPRVEIRKNAPLELPHVMLLYDDRQNSVINCIKRGKVLYDFTLMKDGGKVKGTLIENAGEVVSAFNKLAETNNYGTSDKLLFAVGDGNHSLATAKTCWENLKSKLSEEEKEAHPSRFALVEVVNLYDAALSFEPIHRFVKTDKVEKFISGLKTSGKCCAYIVVGGVKTKIPFDADVPEGIRRLDTYISEFCAELGAEVDYIHGENELINLTFGGVGIVLPKIDKGDFFGLISQGGNLPKKTFSMGEGNEKRYYIEARKFAK